MDFTTGGGLIGAFGLIVAAILIGGQAKRFWDLPSVLIVIGGTFAVTAVCFDKSTIVDAIRITMKAFKSATLSPKEVIALVVDFATTARREGILALEEKAGGVDNAFIKRGIQLAVDGTAPETLREIMETEVAYMEERHKNGADFFSTMGAFAPAFGLIGTLVGLVAMLAQLDDPAAIGPGMAIALLTTFYGAVYANAICLPLEKKLKTKSKEEILSLSLIIEGVMAIQAGDNPRIVEEKLLAYLPPGMRSGVATQGEKKE